jgi:hypothetical protein
MLENKISFIATDKSMKDIWPHPKPASRFIPDEYKKLKRFTNDNLHEPTLKTCVPFLDSLTMGYIIPFDQDYLIDPIENDFSVTPANKERNDFGFHNQTQLPDEWKKTAGENAGKFHNKWLIKTAPGYSCLFIKPMNRLEPRFDIIAGVVDTDTYINTINFPFILNKMWAGFYYEKGHSKVLRLLNSEWVDRYKNMFWKKKSYK